MKMLKLYERTESGITDSFIKIFMEVEYDRCSVNLEISKHAPGSKGCNPERADIHIYTAGVELLPTYYSSIHRNPRGGHVSHITAQCLKDAKDLPEGQLFRDILSLPGIVLVYPSSQNHICLETREQFADELVARLIALFRSKYDDPKSSSIFEMPKAWLAEIASQQYAFYSGLSIALIPIVTALVMYF